MGHWPREINKAKLSPFLFTSFLSNNGKNREIWASLGKFGQGNKKEKLEKRQKELEKRTII